MNRIIDIYRMSPEERKAKYGTTAIQKITIDGVEFSGYKTYTFFWEKTYVKSPVRSNDGSMGNINDYTTFITPHLKMNFSMMSIEDYRKIVNLALAKNEFTVECYDVLTGQSTKNKMYFAPDQFPKIFALPRVLNGASYMEVTGIQDYIVEMIGTNNAIEEQK